LFCSAVKITSALFLALVFLGIYSSDSLAEEKRKIIIGARDDPKGSAFVDENGRFTGLEGEAVQLVVEALPQYEFEFLFLPQKALFPSLITKKVDFVHGNLRRTQEREEQAIRTKVANNWWPYLLAVPATNNDIHTIKDLEGKRLVQNQNSGQALLAEKYIRENNADIELVYSPEFVAMLADGHADATFMSPFTLIALNETHPNFQVKIVDKTPLGGPKGTPDGDPNTYFWFRPEDTKLRDEVSEVIAKLRADGTLKANSLRFCGVDYAAEIDLEAEKDLTR
jgi:ABC-type amino acid transport substrate-binding protein